MKHIQTPLGFLIISILFSISFVSCSEKRPDGPEVEAFVQHINLITKTGPSGNRNEVWALLSDEFKSSFERDIELAKYADSAEVSKLPGMQMLRVLSLKNSYEQQVLQSDVQTITLNWLKSAGKGFPLKNADRYYYTPKQSVEDKTLKDGSTFPQVMIYQVDDSFRFNPFHSEAYQQKRLANILQKKSMEELIKESAWLYFQTHRPVNWDALVDK